MKLYNGRNLAVESPKITPSNRTLDFGYGFYLTSDYEQAAKWAKLTALRRGGGTPTVFEIDESHSGLNILRFDSANADWLHFITANRTGKPLENNYDIIIGPVANDNTMPVINLYLSGSYDEDEALKRLLTQKLKDQYAIKTDKALSKLILKEVITL